MQECLSQDSSALRTDCYFCGRNVAKSSIKKHLERCQKAAKCPICQTYISAEEYTDHTQACAFSEFSLTRPPPAIQRHREVPEEQGESPLPQLLLQSSGSCGPEHYEVSTT